MAELPEGTQMRRDEAGVRALEHQASCPGPPPMPLGNLANRTIEDLAELRLTDGR
jgi:hypothetical protein